MSVPEPVTWSIRVGFVISGMNELEDSKLTKLISKVAESGLLCCTPPHTSSGSSGGSNLAHPGTAPAWPTGVA